MKATIFLSSPPNSQLWTGELPQLPRVGDILQLEPDGPGYKVHYLVWNIRDRPEDLSVRIGVG